MHYGFKSFQQSEMVLARLQIADGQHERFGILNFFCTDLRAAT